MRAEKIIVSAALLMLVMAFAAVIVLPHLPFWV